MFPKVLGSNCTFTSEERNFRGYKLLTQYMSGIEEKLLELEISQLGAYFRDVSNKFNIISCLLHTYDFNSCRKVQEARAAMTLRI